MNNSRILATVIVSSFALSGCGVMGLADMALQSSLEDTYEKSEPSRNPFAETTTAAPPPSKSKASAKNTPAPENVDMPKMFQQYIPMLCNQNDPMNEELRAQLQQDLENIRQTYTDNQAVVAAMDRPVAMDDMEKLGAYAKHYQELYPDAVINLNDPNTKYQLISLPRTICDYPGDPEEVTRFSMYYGYTAWGGREDVVRDYPFAVNLFCPDKSMSEDWVNNLWEQLKQGAVHRPGDK